MIWTLDQDRRAENPVQAARSRHEAPGLTTCPECSAVRTSGQPCPACGWRPQPKPRPRRGGRRRARPASERDGSGDWHRQDKRGSSIAQLLWIARRARLPGRLGGPQVQGEVRDTGRRAITRAPEPPKPGNPLLGALAPDRLRQGAAEARVMSTVERATGRWREILPQLGIATSFLVNRHGPCPLCGGKDRFRWDDRDGTGSYYCNQCGPGPGMLLVRKLHGWDHATACRAIDEIIGRDPPPRARLSQRQARRGDRSPRGPAGTRRTTPAGRALPRGRGLQHLSRRRCAAIRGWPTAEDGQFLGRYPGDARARPGAGRRPASRCTGPISADVPDAKRSCCQPVGRRAPPSACSSRPTSSGIAEGIETAIAAHELFGLPTWATISATIMESFVPPAGVRRLTIFADHDTNFAGQKAAFTLAHRLHRDLKTRRSRSRSRRARIATGSTC